ncbi:MAG: hypothetical protein AABY32_02060 [Nanoarchaeota archaeon]
MEAHLIRDDCLTIRSEHSELVDKSKLIYMDPPYGPKAEDIYYGVGDSLEEYLDWLMERIRIIKNINNNFNLDILEDKFGYVDNFGEK